MLLQTRSLRFPPSAKAAIDFAAVTAQLEAAPLQNRPIQRFSAAYRSRALPKTIFSGNLRGSKFV
jgi:hypothetical protein